MASDRLSWSAPTHLRACQCVPVWPSCFVRALPFEPPRRRLRGTGLQPAAWRLEAEVAGDLELPLGTNSSCGRNAPARFSIHSKRKSEAGISHLTRLSQRNATGRRLAAGETAGSSPHGVQWIDCRSRSCRPEQNCGGSKRSLEPLVDRRSQTPRRSPPGWPQLVRRPKGRPTNAKVAFRRGSRPTASRSPA